MALYNLKAKFFGPNYSLYDPKNNPHDFPDDWEVPAGTEKLDENLNVEEVRNVEGDAPGVDGKTDSKTK